MGYLYEAFFSYKRNRESDLWHKTVKTKLEHWLAHELNQPKAEIYFDSEDIHSGDRWRTHLSDGIRRSRCLVCLWSPGYFQSRWCVSEWLSFVEREKRLGCGSLIVPASYHDGKFFPAEAREYQFRDFSPFASTMPFFWGTSHAVDFEMQHLKPMARDLAAKIRRCPEFDPDSPLVEATYDQVATEPAIPRVAGALS